MPQGSILGWWGRRALLLSIGLASQRAGAANAKGEDTCSPTASMTDFKKEAAELHRAYFLGAYSPADDAGNVAALAAALEKIDRQARVEVYEAAEKMFREEVPCTCADIYKCRGLIAPDCYHYAHGMFQREADRLRDPDSK